MNSSRSYKRPYDFAIRLILSTVLCVLLFFPFLWFMFFWSAEKLFIALIVVTLLLIVIWFPYEKTIKKPPIKNNEPT